MSDLKLSKTRTLAGLFFEMFKISACTFGGGFVIVTFMKRTFVDRLGWLDETEMLDMIALAQSSPGAIAVNAAILTGWRVAGFFGMLAAVLGTILPPMIILGVVSVFYALLADNRIVACTLRGMQAGVAAVILDAALSLGQKALADRNPLRILILVAAFVATFVFRVNVVYIILAAALFGLIPALFERKGGNGGC